MKARTLAGPALVVLLLVTGCSAGTEDTGGGASGVVEAQSETPGHNEDHEHVEGMDMSSSGGPSSAASMICTDEIGDAVARTFALDSTPESTEVWSKAQRVYSCRYELAEGALVLSVQDASDDASGRAYFDGTRRRLPGAVELKGMENFGFPAFATSERVVFLKDGKTLQVDAAQVPAAALRDDYTQRDAAYAVASAVIACWTE